MSEFDKFVDMKRETDEAAAFVALLTNGTHIVASARFDCTLSPVGSGQVVEFPKAFKKAAEAQLVRRTDNLLLAALADMQADLNRQGQRAIAEYKKLLTDVGLAVPAPNPVP
jgi:hypothetical protein